MTRIANRNAPAYLILIDGWLESDPDNAALLRIAATLNGTYASVFVEDVERQRRMTTRARSSAATRATIDRVRLSGRRHRPSPSPCHRHRRGMDPKAAPIPS